jgi:hypothetical protein
LRMVYDWSSHSSLFANVLKGFEWFKIYQHSIVQ